jgi:hypothetical protein
VTNVGTVKENENGWKPMVLVSSNVERDTSDPRAPFRPA